MTQTLPKRSVCSGIEAASVAWNPLGWQAAWFSEIEPFPCAVLAHRFPTVTNLGDMTTLPERIVSGEVEAPDLLCGGTPCQAFSTAGKRMSLADERGNLSLVFCRIADAIDTARSRTGLRPAVIFWENVPGVLHTKDNALGCFFGLLAGSDQPAVAPGGRWPSAGVLFGGRRRIAWRTLDAQHFGVPQRRRRVFVVASASDGFDPAAVLFERKGVSGDSSTGEGTEQDIAAGTGDRSPGDRNGVLAYMSYGQSAYINELHDKSEALTAKFQKGTADGVLLLQYAHDDGRRMANGSRVTDTLAAHDLEQQITSQTGGGVLVLDTPATQSKGHVIYDMTHGDDVIRTYQDTSPTIKARCGTGGNQVPITLAEQPVLMTCPQYKVETGCAPTKLGRMGTGGNQVPVTPGATGVRRLTPVECERLQGFPDNWTRIPFRNKPEENCPDSHRYKAIGNSWAVPVVRWIGNRINQHMEGLL